MGPLVPITDTLALTIVPDGMLTVKANTMFRGLDRSPPGMLTDAISIPGVPNPKPTVDGDGGMILLLSAPYRKFEMTEPSGWVQLAPLSASHASTLPGHAAAEATPARNTNRQAVASNLVPARNTASDPNVVPGIDGPREPSRTLPPVLQSRNCIVL